MTYQTPTRPDWVAPYRDAIDAGIRVFAAKVGLPPEDPLLVAAIGLRETWMGHSRDYVPAGSPDGTGDHGHGRGFFQIDDRGPFKYLIRPAPWPVDVQAAACCEVLADARRVLAPYERSDRYEAAVLCSYNAGTKVVAYLMSRDRDPNWPTTGHNYGTDVIRVRDGLRALAGLDLP